MNVTAYVRADKLNPQLRGFVLDVGAQVQLDDELFLYATADELVAIAERLLDLAVELRSGGQR